MMYNIPDDLHSIFSKACNDCHSNNTRYPWYAYIQPVGWWLNNDITEGKQKLNFNEFGKYSIAKQYKKLDDIIDESKHGDMPLKSYTLIHTDARLTDAEKEKIFAWCNNVRSFIKAKYPADSLLLKKESSPQR